MDFLQEKLRSDDMLDDLQHHHSIELIVIEDRQPQIQIKFVRLEPERIGLGQIRIAQIDESNPYTTIGHPAR